MLFSQNIKAFFLSLCLRLFLNSILLTCRFKVENLDVFLSAIHSKKPTLVCFWHRELIYVANFFKNNPWNVFAVSSTHFDSEVLGKILTSWKIRLIKGSSTRGWVNVLKRLILLSKNPSTIVTLTNDGPKGPPLVAKEGSLSVAEKHGYQIVAISGKSSNQWRLKSWDKTFIPKPFSLITIRFSSLYPNNKKIDSKNITEFINQNNLFGGCNV